MRIKELARKISESYSTATAKAGAVCYSPSETQGRLLLFMVGVTILTFGLLNGAAAENATRITFEDTRLGEVVEALLLFIEGSFGALIMVAAGIGAIVSSAFGQYRAALGLLAVGVGAFVLRSLVRTFFNYDSIAAADVQQF